MSVYFKQVHGNRPNVVSSIVRFGLVCYISGCDNLRRYGWWMMNESYSYFDIRKIFDVVLAFNSVLQYGELHKLILLKMMDITRSDAGTLYIVEDGMLHFKIVTNNSLGIHHTEVDEINLPPIKLDSDNIDNISAFAAINNQIVMVDDVYTSKQFNFNGPKEYDKITGYRTRSMLVLPLSTYWDDEPEVLGVIQLINPTDPDTGEVVPYIGVFHPPSIPALANVAANTLSNLIHIKEIRRIFQSFAAAMAKAVEERSRYSSNHTHKVAGLCEAFVIYTSKKYPEGHKYHFDEFRREELIMAAMLHDIGKLVIPVAILDKTDRLGAKLSIIRLRLESKKAQLEVDMLKGHITAEEYKAKINHLQEVKTLIESTVSAPYLDDETVSRVGALAKLTYRNWDGGVVPLFDPGDIEALSVREGTLTPGERGIVQEHADVVFRILSNITFKKYYKNLPEWTRNHHELLDGTGYPRGLKGDSLDLEVCIITMMDIFEALTASDRPYKKALPVGQAIEIIKDMAEQGKLHKELVTLFIDSEVWQGVI